MDKSIYELELHEEMIIIGYKLLKVHTGYIYYSWNYDKQDYNNTGVFVPELF